MNIVKINSKNFQENVLGSELPVVVDFYAEWCPPCFVLSEVLDRISREYRGKVKFVKLDIDENRELAGRYGVLSVPTLAFFREGELVDGVVGVITEEVLKKKLKNLFGV